MSLLLSQYIDGQASEAQGALKNHLSPWDQSVLSEWKSANEMDVIRCLQSAKKFLAKPNGWPVEERVDILKKTAAVLQENAERWALLEAVDQGLPKNFVLENGFLHLLSWIEENITAIQEEKKLKLAPSGVVAVITSWCLSFRLVMSHIIPAMAAGNAVIVKVSSKSPVTSLILQELAEKAGWPQGSVQILLGDGPLVGNFLASHPGVRAVAFVGKTKTAESIIKVAAPQFKKIRVRAGSKNVALVLPGFESKYLDELLNSFLIGQGQLGWGMSKLLTTEADAPALIQKIRSRMAQIPVSRSPEDSSPLTPLRNENNLDELKAKALEDQAKVLHTNQSFPSTFLLDLSNCSVLQQDELGQPLFPIVTVKYPHELAKWANNTTYGNLAVLWGDEEKARRLADKLEFGGIWFNHWMRRQDVSPWGLKQSSFGIPEALATGLFYSDQKLTV